MGYETKLIFVTNYTSKKGKIVGYCRKEATLEMGKVAYGWFGSLIDKLQANVAILEEKYRDKIEQVNVANNQMFDRAGEWTKEYESISVEERNKEYTNLISKPTQILEKALPFIYEGNDKYYEDNYGNFFLVATLQEVKEAIVKDNAKDIAKGETDIGYRRYAIALKMIEAFEHDFGEPVFVILAGH